MKTFEDFEKEALEKRKQKKNDESKIQENPFRKTLEEIRNKKPVNVKKQAYPVLRKVNVPKRYKSAKISDYNFEDKILNKYLRLLKKATDNGRGLNILGTNGNGKTRFIHALIREYILLNSDEYFEECKKDTKIIKFLDFRKKCMLWIKDPVKIDKYLDDVKKSDLLVIDDFLKSDITEMQLSFLLDILDFRYENLKSTLITSNATKEYIINKCGSTLWDRIGNINYTLEITADSLRPEFDDIDLEEL